MKECSKSIMRRLSDPNFAARYFCGNGIDIGGAPDPIDVYQELFPRMGQVRIWDLQDGDAQFMEGVEDESYDFIHSSHCLEHLNEPSEGLANWFRILKPEGHMIITVPDEDMYEQGIFPSTYNNDHKWTFTVFKTNSWSARSRNLTELVSGLGEEADIQKIERLTSTFRFNLPRFDQTLTPIGECGIEIIIRKRSCEEAQFGGRKPKLGGINDDGFRLLTGFNRPKRPPEQ